MNCMSVLHGSVPRHPTTVSLIVSPSRPAHEAEVPSNKGQDCASVGTARCSNLQEGNGSDSCRNGFKTKRSIHLWKSARQNRQTTSGESDRCWQCSVMAENNPQSRVQRDRISRTARNKPKGPKGSNTLPSVASCSDSKKTRKCYTPI